jgi:hypothetical protein
MKQSHANVLTTAASSSAEKDEKDLNGDNSDFGFVDAVYRAFREREQRGAARNLSREVVRLAKQAAARAKAAVVAVANASSKIGEENETKAEEAEVEKEVVSEVEKGVVPDAPGSLLKAKEGDVECRSWAAPAAPEAASRVENTVPTGW